MNQMLFKQLNLHDQSLDNFKIDLILKKIEICLNIYSNGNEEDYTCCFFDISNLKISELVLDKIDSLEISSVRHEEQKDFSSVSFMLILGSSLPSAEISFDYGNVQMQKR